MSRVQRSGLEKLPDEHEKKYWVLTWGILSILCKQPSGANSLVEQTACGHLIKQCL